MAKFRYARHLRERAESSVAERRSLRDSRKAAPPPRKQPAPKEVPACMYFANVNGYPGQGPFKEAQTCIPNVDSLALLANTVGKTGSVSARAQILDASMSVACFSYEATPEGRAKCRADRKNRCLVYAGQCGNVVYDYVIYNEAACKGAPYTEFKRCATLFKDECTGNCEWNIRWVYDSAEVQAAQEASDNEQNSGETVYGACMDKSVNAAVIDNYGQDISKQVLNYTKLDQWQAENANAVGDCPYGKQVKESKDYEAMCRSTGTVPVEPFPVFPNGVALVANGQYDIASALKCQESGCYLSAYSAPYLTALSKGHNMTDDVVLCRDNPATKLAMFLNRDTDGPAYVALTECSRPENKRNKEGCEGVKIKI
ncbi:hypothetical protein HXX76_012873 [Chlamydomonas incerta]|uniref:Uncharacterized protein n=1 Tax=Chlamydomonas incerta TaxID=51695 RepID=A0A835VVM7_CHLIN|nr:hypothetical protein HXX76_012873 [Chlamydomonas incerta]|eukprot:KAG2426821.1 hypothetical protein HXX76_012873 [Chlamydomonas incerta]